ncbi:MAG: DUF1450 domain-containing protein [Halobacteriaceae archaeon]
MTDTVEYCIGNVDLDARALLRDSEFDTVESFCLDRCGECCDGAFVVADGELRLGEDHAAVLDAVREEGEA